MELEKAKRIVKDFEAGNLEYEETFEASEIIAEAEAKAKAEVEKPVEDEPVEAADDEPGEIVEPGMETE